MLYLLLKIKYSEHKRVFFHTKHSEIVCSHISKNIALEMIKIKFYILLVNSQIHSHILLNESIFLKKHYFSHNS